MESHLPLPSFGILNWNNGKSKFKLTRCAPSADLAFFVKHYWIVRWDLAGQEPYLQDILPNPSVNLVVEQGKTAVYGPSQNKFSYLYQEAGCVFGVKFKPGGFYPFTKQPVSRLSADPMPHTQALGLDLKTVEAAVLRAQQEDQAMVELMESFLRPKTPAQDETVILINQIIDKVMQDRTITRVDDIADSFQMNIRKLQRLFRQYVGVSPKWVIRLYRLHNAAEALEQGQSLDWLDLSLELGYHDQSHFIKDFKTVIGHTPEEYMDKISRGFQAHGGAS